MTMLVRLLLLLLRLLLVAVVSAIDDRDDLLDDDPFCPKYAGESGGRTTPKDAERPRRAAHAQQRRGLSFLGRRVSLTGPNKF